MVLSRTNDSNVASDVVVLCIIFRLDEKNKEEQEKGVKENGICDKNGTQCHTHTHTHMECGQADSVGGKDLVTD